ncbi:transmembrane protein, putative (macronuclear) [Tetrahymena thermophila SB210]|uniref:Transmembrane protein, putative n=1 Tax=Tetrahymena thermophila (strain SB210) TaxID=312017 RepID=W7X5T2_TETTS|nr:transmembrane protein, putative [Tetrahymena thermophila SB210]EWS74720.1 transmembrane protein, putative [Tetrahymena thermophila SB210]|eukprot:XP_012652721.1 transmembrane protein, putative [Tetrahymena thermophila SB210]
MNNLNQLQIYKLIQSNTSFNLEYYTNFSLISSQKLLKLQKQYQNQYDQILEGDQQYEIALMNSQIQIIRQNFIYNSQLEGKIIDNYQMPYPTPSSQVNSLVLIYQPSLLLSCHQNGDILFYDTSSGIDFKLINKIQNQQAQCLQIGRFNNNYVVVQMSDSILLIDPYLQQVINSNKNLNNINSLSINYDKVAISYNNCIIILSPIFQQLFNLCDDSYFLNVQSVFLNNDLKLYVQTSQAISIYQTIIQQSSQQQESSSQSVIQINSITLKSSITYFNCIVLFKSDQDKINNIYSIDEIVIYDSQFSFSIFDSSLQLIHKVSNIALSSVNQAKRVVNDNTAYFLIGYSKSANPVVRIHGITKTSEVSFANDFTFQYSPFIDDPIKNVNQAGKVYYHVKHIMQLNFFSLHEEYQMDFDRNITYTCGHDYIYGATQTTQVKLQIGSSNNYLDYVGTQQGLSGALKYQLKRYEILSTSNIFSGSHSNDQIQQVLQSTNLYMYFVITSYQISSFNLFTNQFIELLSPQLSSDPPFTSISEILILKSIICWNSNQILLSTYGSINQKYYFKGFSQINGWVFDDVNNYFFIYGSSLAKLDTKLKYLLNISNESQNLNFIVCHNTQNTIICSNSPSQFSIIDKKKNTIQIVQVNGFQSQFKIGLDEAQQNIYLYDTQVYIYNLQGVFNQVISLNANTLNTFEVQTAYVIFSSYQYMAFLDRKSFSLESQIVAPSGLSILKYIYLKELSEIMLYCNNSLFAQIYIYSIPSGTLAGKISGVFSWNKVGVVIDMAYDSDQTKVLYLDDTGNFYIYELYNEYTLLNNYKFTEIYDRNESLLGFTFNREYNNIFVYSKTSIYQINYSKTGVKYEFGLKEPWNLFTSIPISQYETQFIVVNNNNNIFKYKNLTMQYENTLNQQPIDVVYDPSLDVLVYAFSNHLSFTFELNQYRDILLVGFSNGQLLQYSLNNQYSKYYTISDTQAISISVIKIIIDDDNQQQQQAIAVTNGGQAILIDLNNNLLIKKIDLISLVNEDNQVNLQGLIYDKVYSRYIFYFSGQKKAYVWNFMSNQQENFLMLPNDQANNIKQTNLWILTSCYYQINVYSKAKNIQLFNIIKRNIFRDSIMDYQVINDNQIIILLQSRFEIFLIQESKSMLIYQQQSVYPRFLGYIYNQVKNFLKIYMLDSTKLYEANISLGIYEDNTVTQCASIIITSPQNQTDNNLILAQDTFQNIQQQILYLSNYSLVFQNSNQTQSISMNQNIQKIICNYTQNNQQITLMDDILQFESFISNNNSLNSQPIYEIRSSIVEINNLTHSQNQGNFMISLSNQVKISNSQFIQNYAQNGGAIYFQGILSQIQINSSQFFGNQANSSGGAIYMEDIGSCEVIFNANSTVQNNTALIGGGIRIVKKNADKLILPQKYPFQHNVFNNKAEIYGDDSTTYLQNLIFQNYKIPDEQASYNFSFSDNQNDVPLNYQSQYQKSISISNFQSGGYLVLRIYIVDNYNRYLSFSKEYLTQGLYPQEVELELKGIEVLIDNLNNQQTQLIGEKILNYNQYDTNSKSYELTGLSIYGKLETQQIFSISSSVFSLSQNQKTILMQIQFRKCLLGEIIEEQTTQISICKQCYVGSYQLIDPQTLLQQSLIKQQDTVKNQCNYCPLSASFCQGSIIILKNDYWRSGNNSDEILECNTYTNSCQAENPQSFEGCVQGYIGPLCEQCDITGEIWESGRYTQQINLGFLFINQFLYSQTCYYLRAMKMFPISKNSVKDYSGFYIKIIVNYLQLSSLLIQQPQIIPASFDALGNFIGKSNKQVSLGIDCMISKDAFNNLGKVVIYALIQSLIPLVFIVFMCISLFVIQQIRQKWIKKYHYWTLFQILYIFFQLEQIQYFSNSLTCRQIGSQKYNPNDLTQLCEQEHIQVFIKPFSLIILFGWSIMPLTFLYQLYKKKNKLDECHTKYSFGFFYGELKSKYYFWEFVRMYLKVTLVYLHIFLSNSLLNFSEVLVIVIVGAYIIAVFYFQPFVSKQISKSEIIAYAFIILKILLKILAQDLNSSQFIIELSILIIDYILFVSLIGIILINKIQNQQSILGKVLIAIIFKILPTSIAKKAINFRKVSLKAYFRWKFIRSNIYCIIQQKANQNIDNIKDKFTNGSKQSQNQQQSHLVYFQNSSINTNCYSQQSSPKQLIDNLKKKRNFQIQDNNYPNQQINLDYVNEDQDQSQGDDQTEQLDPKKVQQYNFQTRPSVYNPQINIDLFI